MQKKFIQTIQLSFKNERFFITYFFKAFPHLNKQIEL